MSVAVWVSSGQAEESPSDDAQNIQLMLKSINNDIVALRLLISNIKSEQTSDRDVLVFLQDERVFRILSDYDSLASETAGLPEGSSQRQIIIQQLPEFGIGYGDDIELAERVLKDIVSAREKVLAEP